MRPAHPDRPSQPLLIVGWDGATPELLEPWMADGTLPNLAALAQRGSYSPLRSLIHPLSPAAWTSAMTGLNPGRHGVWDFGHIQPGTYTVEPTTGAQRKGATVWEIADQCGLRSLVGNVPLSHPCRPFDGVYIPGLGATSLDGTTHPKSIGRLIDQTVPDYRIDSNIYEHAAPAEFLASVAQMVEARTRVFEDLLRRDKPDLFVGVYVSTDRVQHAFWKQGNHPWLDGKRAGWTFGSAIKDTYVQLDAALGRLIAACPGDPTVLVISDHGFGDLDGDLYLNAVLEDMGLLRVSHHSRQARRRGERFFGLMRRFGGGAEDAAPEPCFGDIDWEQTQAYSRGLFGNIWLNIRGREPVGQVEPGPEAEGLMERITDRLLALREPGGHSAPLIDAVFRGSDLYSSEDGGPVEGAPDLVVVPRDYRWMTRSGREIGAQGCLTCDPAIRHTGNHRMNGVLVAGGPGITVGAPAELRRLIDVTPTALALLGIEVPRSLDGKPMSSLMSCDNGWTDDVPAWEPLGEDSAPSDASAEELTEQLKGLGYLAP
jgi:predicted AlkP superfamily phosphohydrolase/phosphomutase